MNTPYQQTLEYLFSKLPMYQRVGSTAFKKDLTNTLKLCEVNGNPHLKLKCIHIAGTNGKGSVSHIIASILQSQGYKVGLYTSPHYKDFRERIKINGEYISEEAVVNFTEKNRKSFDLIEPSFFEMTVVMAFDYFVTQKVDYAVIEVGLGGRLDSTNVITPLLSVITNISYDHMDMLGNTLAEIATEKAGIIKSNIPVVIGETHVETEPVFIKKAEERNSEIIFSERINSTRKISQTFDNVKFSFLKNGANNIFYETDLTGSYQMKNINTALTACFYLKEKNIIAISEKAIETGIQNVKKIAGLIGRFQIINKHPLTILDSAHNEGGIKILFSELKEYSFNVLHIVFGTVKDKDLTKIFTLLPKNAKYYFCKANIPRGLDADQLKLTASEYSLIGESYNSVKEAYTAAQNMSEENDAILVAGSIFVLAEVL